MTSYKKYNPITNNHTLSSFHDYISAIDIPCIDYFAIGVQNTISKSSASLMSNSEWQSCFNAMGLAQFDPIRKASLNTSINIFSFNDVSYEDTNAEYIMNQRRKHGIVNGIVLMKRDVGHNFMLTLATGYSKFNPYSFFTFNEKSCHRVFKDLIKVISSEAIKYKLNL